MNSQPATPPKPVKTRFKLGLILGLILGVGIGVGGCLPVVFHFQKNWKAETASKLEVQEQLQTAQANIAENQENIETLDGDLANWKQKFDDESSERQRLDKEVKQIEDENAQAEKENSAMGKQIEEQSHRITELKGDNDALSKDKGDLQRENQTLKRDLTKSQSLVKSLQDDRDRATQAAQAQRAATKDGVMTVVGMADDVTLPLDGPINTLRVVDWPSKKQEDRFCYESSRNGQKVTLYFNLVPFGTIEHKVLKGKDTLVLSWKDDSPLFWSDRGQKNRDVSFEKQVAYRLSQNGVAFLYESKSPNREKYIDLKFVSD